MDLWSHEPSVTCIPEPVYPINSGWPDSGQGIDIVKSFVHKTYIFVLNLFEETKIFSTNSQQRYGARSLNPSSWAIRATFINTLNGKAADALAMYGARVSPAMVLI